NHPMTSPMPNRPPNAPSANTPAATRKPIARPRPGRTVSCVAWSFLDPVSLPALVVATRHHPPRMGGRPIVRRRRSENVTNPQAPQTVHDLAHDLGSVAHARLHLRDQSPMPTPQLVPRLRDSPSVGLARRRCSCAHAPPWRV